MLIHGLGYSYNPDTTPFMEAVMSAYKAHVAKIGTQPTHVSLPKTVNKEDMHMVQQGMGLTISGTNHGCPLIIMGMPKES